MNIGIFRSLVAVVDHGSFAAAARVLGLSQSAITAHVQALETDLSRTLFDRSKRPALLTEAGAAATARARELLATYDDLMSAPGRSGTVEGRLRLGAVGSVLTGILPSVLTALRASHPGLHVEVVSGFSATLLHLVDHRRLDAALVSDYDGTTRDIDWCPLLREPLVMIAPAKASGQSVRELASGYPFIRYSPNASLGRLIDHALRETRLVVHETMRLDWLDAIEVMVQHGHGISIVPQPLFPSSDRSGIRALAFSTKTFHRTVGLIAPVDGAKQKLTDILVGEVRALVKRGQTDHIP
jgi:DNA-binding transcriptional LysR family regulator